MSTGLEGIKVIEAASAVAAPMVGRLLADWGADVIHIDHTARGGLMHKPPAVQDSRSIGASFNYVEQNINCNKRAIALDLSIPGGREILHKLIAGADVFLNNFRPRELKKFQLEYDDLRRFNPQLICGNLTGFGRKGPEQNEPGFGPTAGDSKSGLMHVLQSQANTEPVQMPVAYADFLTALTLAYGIMTALLIRERTGVAQEVDASLFNSLTFALTSDIAGTLVTGQDRQAVRRCDRNTPLANTYQTKDGRWLYLMMTRQHVHWEKFCDVLECEEMKCDPRYDPTCKTEDADPRALFDDLDRIFRTRTLAEWKPRLAQIGFPWAPVQSLPEVISDPQARANNFFVPLKHPEHGDIEIIANPVKLSETMEKSKAPAPKFDQHTEEILLEIGYSAEEVFRFREEGVII